MSPAATATRSGNPASRVRPTVPEPEDAPARPLGRVLSAAQFWELMQRWHVPDAQALALIAYPGKPPQLGKRPRFRFTTRQQRLTGYLPELDAALSAAGKDAAWLHRRNRSGPFSGGTPLEHMIAGGADGAADVLRVLHRMALRAAMTQT